MVYLFLGKEQFLKKEKLQQLKAKVSGSAYGGLNCEEFQAGESDLNGIIDCANTAPFMAKFRLIIINAVDEFNPQEKEKLILFINNQPSAVLLALLADSLPAQDLIYRAVKKKGRVFIFDLLQGGELRKWVTDRFLYFNKRIETDAVNALLDNVGNDLTQLNLAAESLASFVGAGDTVKAGDIEVLIGRSSEAVSFDLTDAIASRNLKLALEILQGLDKDNKNAPQIIGLIGWQLGRIWRAKKLADRRMPIFRITTTVGVPQYAKNSFVRQMNNFSIQELEKGFKVLLKLDRDIKSTAMQPHRALEFLIIGLCSGF